MFQKDIFDSQPKYVTHYVLSELYSLQLHVFAIFKKAFVAILKVEVEILFLT